MIQEMYPYSSVRAALVYKSRIGIQECQLKCLSQFLTPSLCNVAEFAELSLSMEMQNIVNTVYCAVQLQYIVKDASTVD